MGNRIKSRVHTAMAKGFKTTNAGRGPRKGEQGKSRDPGYSGGKRKEAVGTRQAKVAYAKRRANS